MSFKTDITNKFKRYITFGLGVFGAVNHSAEEDESDGCQTCFIFPRLNSTLCLDALLVLVEDLEAMIFRMS